MATDPGDSDPRKQRFENILAQYLQAREAGQAPTRDELLARHPDLADELALFFANKELFDRLAQPLGPVLPRSAVHVICPHCRNPIELVQDPKPEEVICPSCGSSFRLEQDRTLPWAPRSGQKVGRFELLETVGVGAFGTVYKARDPELDRMVAIKVPRTGNLAGKEDLDRFLREARSVAQLRHPGIVTVHEVGEWRAEGASAPVPYIVSEFVEGVTLADLLSARRPTPREAAHLIAALADALQYAHERGIVHRDVKPSNIMLENEGAGASERKAGSSVPALPLSHALTPKLMDFGLAKRAATEIAMTLEGQVLGTPAYMSPEQARGEAHQVDGRGDVYSLGVILYQMLTGELPFRGTARMLLHQVLHDEPRSPRGLNDRIAKDMETICLQALAKEPGRRYQSARALADDLRRFLNGEPVLARPVGRIEKTWRWCRRNPALASVSATAAAIILTLTAMYFWNMKRQVATTMAALDNEQIERQKAKSAQAEAEKNAKESRQRLGRLYAQSGLRSLEEGDVSGALTWLSESLQIDKGDPTGEDVHRLRLGSLWPRCPRLTQVWFHEGAVSHVELSGDGKWLVSAGQDRMARIWELATGKAVGPPMPHGKAVQRATFSPDGRRLLTISGPKHSVSGNEAGDVLFSGGEAEVNLWETATGQPLMPPLKCAGDPLQGPQPRSAAFSSDGRWLLVVSQDSKDAEQCHLRVWDATTGKLVFKEEVPLVSGHAVFTPDGRRLLVVDQVYRILETATAKLVRAAFGQHADHAHEPVLSRDGRFFFVIERGFQNREDQVHVWDMTGQRAGPPIRHHPTFQAAFSPDGRRLLTVSSADGAINGMGQVLVWDVATAKPLTPLLRHRVAVKQARFSADGRNVLTITEDGLRWTWDLSTGKSLHPPNEARAREHWWNPATQIVSPNEVHVLRMHQNGTVQLWHMTTGEPVTPPLKHGSPVTSACFRPDGSAVFTACADGKVCLWEFALAEQEFLPAKHPEVHERVFYSADGSRALTYQGQILELWDTATGQRIGPREKLQYRSGPSSVAFSRDNRRVLAMGQRPFNFMVGDVTRGTWVRLDTTWHSDDWPMASLSPDGSRVLTVTGIVHPVTQVWDAVTGKRLYAPLDMAVSTVAAWFSPDGRHVLTIGNPVGSDAGKSAQARVWHAATGQPVTPPLDCKGYLKTGAFSPDAQYVILGANDVDEGKGTVQKWEIATGKSIGPPLVAGKEVNDVAFSPDGRRVFTVGGDPDTGLFAGRLWDAGTGESVAVFFNCGPPVAFSPDGRYVAALRENTSAQVWDVQTGKAVTALLKHGEPLHRILFSPDSRRLLTCGIETSRVWHIDSGEAIGPLLKPHATLFRAAHYHGEQRALAPPPAWPSLPRDDRPVEDLQSLARILSHMEIGASGNYVPLEGPAFRRHWDALQAKYGRDGLAPAPRQVLAWHHQAARDCAEVMAWEGAILHLDRLLEAGPVNWKLHFDRGRAQAGLGKLEQAITSFTRAIEMRADWDRVWLERAQAHAQLEQWKQAAADFVKFTKEDARNDQIWHELALVHLAAGNTDDYRKLCAQLWNVYSGTPMTFVLAAGAVPDFERLLSAVETPVKNGYDGPNELRTLGMVLYRAGRTKEALDRLHQAIKAHDHGGTPWDWLFLAMSYHHLDNAKEAHKWLDKAAEALKPGPNPRPFTWQQRLELRILSHEAEGLVKKRMP